MGKRGPPPGTPKTPGSGRQKGTKNSRTLELEDRVAKILGCSPVDALAQVAKEELDKGEAGDRSLAVKALSECASYVLPKRKAIEHTGEGGTPISFELVLKEHGNPGR